MSEKSIRELASDYAIENFKNGLNCSESVFEALVRSGALDVPSETVAMSFGFGGGVGLSGVGACGALSAAVMANGAIYGREDPWSIPKERRMEEIQKRYYRRYNNMIHEFIEANGSPTCEGICSKYEGFHCKDRRINCLKLIGKTAAMAVDYLNLDQEEAFELPYKGNVADLE